MTTTVPRPGSSSVVPTTVEDTSARFGWLAAVREREERRARTARLRAELKAARDAGLVARQRARLARIRRQRDKGG